ncbi:MULTISPECIES: hypothetical protein [unclassified Bartonella]
MVSYSIGWSDCFRLFAFDDTILVVEGECTQWCVHPVGLYFSADMALALA